MTAFPRTRDGHARIPMLKITNIVALLLLTAL